MFSISAVICSKNDSKDNNLRMTLALKNMINLYDEIIIVDYGSEIPLHKTLIDLLPKTNKLRCINVSQDLTQRFNPDNPTSFMEVWARNIGICRATSDFIVSTNQDVIIDRPNIINEDTMYTVARYCVPESHLQSISNQTNYLEFLKNIKGQFEKHPNSTDEQGRPTWDPGDIWSLVVSCGDFQIAHKNIWNKIKGFEETMIHRGYADSNIMRKASKFFKIQRMDIDIFHLDHPANTSYHYQVNDRMKYVNNFDETTNSDTWGFSDIEIPEVRI